MLGRRRQLSFYSDPTLNNHWHVGRDQHRYNWCRMVIVEHYRRTDGDVVGDAGDGVNSSSIRRFALIPLGYNGWRCYSPPSYMMWCPALKTMVAVYRVSPKNVSMMTDKTMPTRQSISLALGIGQLQC